MLWPAMFPSTFESLIMSFFSSFFLYVSRLLFSLTLTNIFSHLFSFSDFYLIIDTFVYSLFDFFPLMNWLVKAEKFEQLPISAL